jgi:hypothetical protein
LVADLDGDGRRKTMVACLAAAWRAQHHLPVEIYVDALSGSDGGTVWTWRKVLGPRRERMHQPAEGAYGPGLAPPLWWHADPGGPLLLVLPLALDRPRPAAEVRPDFRFALVLASWLSAILILSLGWGVVRLFLWAGMRWLGGRGD